MRCKRSSALSRPRSLALISQICPRTFNVSKRKQHSFFCFSRSSSLSIWPRTSLIPSDFVLQSDFLDLMILDCSSPSFQAFSKWFGKVPEVLEVESWSYYESKRLVLSSKSKSFGIWREIRSRFLLLKASAWIFLSLKAFLHSLSYPHRTQKIKVEPKSPNEDTSRFPEKREVNESSIS